MDDVHDPRQRRPCVFLASGEILSYHEGISLFAGRLI